MSTHIDKMLIQGLKWEWLTAEQHKILEVAWKSKRYFPDLKVAYDKLTGTIEPEIKALMEHYQKVYNGK